MDGISSETNEEKDPVTRPVRRRHSSILKPPRSPLQDLRNGNETVQESFALRNRKSSRRVSFADTIKVFQTESHMTTGRKSEITETEAGENILNIQNKNSDDNYCEITGMDTLLCAPIQTQQKELSFMEYNYERKQANDQTVIFSDENQMDLTASHTVIISKGLSNCSESETSMKIDTTSFLANLKHHAETSTMKNELKCPMNQNTSPAKKINWNDFIKRLKTGKYIASSTGPDKENSEMLIYSKGSNSAASTHQMHVSANVDENGSNRTRIFSEQDDGMNFTHCHTGNIQTLVPPFTNANLGEFKGDITIYGSECMDLTTNHVVQVLPSASNTSETENQTRNLMMDVATVCGAKAPEEKTVLKDKLTAAFQDSFLNPQHTTRSCIMGSETHTVPQTCKQDAKTLTMTSESLRSSQAIQGYKTVFYSSCNDAMELTKCLSGMTEEKSLLKHDDNYSKTCTHSDTSPLLTEKTIYSGEDSMDITKSHTVAIDNNIFKQDQSNTKNEIAIPISGKEVMFQNHITVLEDENMNINCNSVQVSKERLLQSPINSLSVSVTDQKSKLLAGEGTDLTESHISNLRNKAPLASCDLVPENITKSYSTSLSDEWKKMVKSLIQPSQQPDKHILTDTQAKEKQVLMISSCPDKDSSLSVHYNEDTATNHNRAWCCDLDKRVLLRHKEQGQHSELPEPQKKNLNEPTPDCFHDKTVCSEEEQAMDLTKSHTVVIGFGPSEVEELSNTNLGHRTSQLTAASRQIAVKVEKCDKSPPEKTIITNDMAELEDRRIQKPGFLKEKQNVNKICRRKSVGGLKIDKTIIFSEGNENDMDITKSYTVEINHKPLLDKHNFDLMSLAGTSKTVSYACGQDDTEITRSHTTALEYRTVSPHEKTSRPLDKTVVFVDHDELEMTKSHTVFIDYQAEDKSVLPERLNIEQSKRKSLVEPKVTSAPAEESVSFAESDHLAAKGSQLTVLEKGSSNGPRKEAVTFIADNTEVSKLTTSKNVKDLQKPGFLNELLLGKSQRRNSLGFKNGKTIEFSENDKNNIDNTQSPVVGISNKITLEDREVFSLVPMTETCKTVLYAFGRDDMEITRSHTNASACRTVSPDEMNSRPLDKTVVFVDDHDELEMTKSHTVFIDCQAEDKAILSDRLKIEQSKRKSLQDPKVTSAPAEENVFFSEDNESVHPAAKGGQLTVLEEGSSNGPRKEADDLEVTKSHTVFIDCQATEILHEYPKFEIATGENLNHNCAQEITKKQAAAEQKHFMATLIPTHTLCSDKNKREIIKCHRIDMEEKVIGKDQTYILEATNSTDRRNVHFTNSHTDTVCGSSDNYSCLPNVTTFDKLEHNSISLGDKKKEKASNCQVKNELVNVHNLASGYCVVSERLPVFASCPLKEEIIQTNSKGHLDCAITLPKDQDLIKEPQNQTLMCSQNLEEMAKVNKHVSVKLPNEQLNVSVDDICVASQPHLSTQQLQPLTHIVNKDETLSNARNETLNFLIENSSIPTFEKESKIPSNEKHLIVSCKKELKESIQKAKCNTSVDCISNLDLTTQVIQTHANDGKASESTVKSNVLGSSIVRQSLNNLNGKTEESLDFQAVHVLPPPEQLLKLEDTIHSNVSIVQAIETHGIVSKDANDKRDEETRFHNEAGTIAAPLKRVVKDKMRRCSLGIFLPKLPNKRNCSVTGIDDLEQIPADLNYLETQPVSSKDSDIGSVVAKLNLSPSQYINEENLPIYPGEINSLDSISTEIEEKALTEISHKEILPFKNKMEETCNIQKRTWVQEDDGVPTEKKIRKADTTQEKEIFDHHTEEDIDKNVTSILMKSLSRTPSSCSSSLDSIKADGTSLDFSTHRNSQMESQFLDDTIGEENLREKLKDGRITIREFFILLQVHILIQKPRQSNLPAKFTINTSPTPEDLMLRQYVYGPKIQIYREDCEILRQKIEELKVSALNQDKLLTDVNRNLWQKMRHCSDKELKTFGMYLNKIKSSYTKMTKVFTHQGKVALYSKLVHSAQNEKEKLQLRINEMDGILKKINNYLTEVEIETKNLENEEKYSPTEEWDSEMRVAEKELEQLKIEEEELQRKLLEVEIQKEQALAKIQFIQKQVNETEKLLDQLSMSEWKGIEWSDDQAVFSFVYDSIELTILFGEPVVGLPFLDKTCRMITELNFQSLLDEDKAPPSSLLVHKLIFQYIEQQESWRKKCITQHQVPQMLQELSLVVKHCRLLGEEIEFLKRWGPNYNLMNIDMNDTKLTLLFSSYAAFVKFEIIFSMSAHYPLIPLPFAIQNHIGNTDHNEIAAIMSKVPFEDNYLKNVVKQIYQDLLKDCHFYH